MISLNDLNPNQKKAAETIEGPVLILAGAGSGKTRTITYRIAHMVNDHGIDPKKILGVSFTNKAAKEMQERMSFLVDKKKSADLTLSTFHSLGVKILKEDITALGYKKTFSIYDSSDQLSIVREALKSYRAEKKFDKKEILSKIGKLKNNGVSNLDFPKSSFFDAEDPYDLACEYVYNYYQEKLRFYNAIDFDDILFLTTKLFHEHPEIAKKYSRKFQYIMIDEYQDTNPLQFNLILGLTSTHHNLCVVGDDDQAIYAFRGADVSNILNFESNFPDAKVIKLQDNYRSTKPILSLANHIIKENKNRREKELIGQKESTQTPLLWAMGDADHEAMVIIDDILKYQANGNKLSDVAILYRSNTQTGPIEDELRLSQVPYEVLGGQKFYEKKEIKDLMAYLGVILNPSNEISLRRILNVPNRGIGTATLNKFLQKAAETKSSLFIAMEKYPALIPNKEGKIRNFCEIIRKYQKMFKEKSLEAALEALIEQIDYYSFVDKQYDSPAQAEVRKNDVRQFIISAERFDRNLGKHATLKNFVEKLLLQDSQDNKEEKDDDHEKKNAVTMMTLHSSKGLEFNRVYLIGMEEELLPHKKTISLGEDISEERRLCYVGVTRAKEQLIMSYCKERMLYGKKAPRHKSRFLTDLKDASLYVEQDRTKFGHLSDDEAQAYKKNFFDGLISSLD